MVRLGILGTSYRGQLIPMVGAQWALIPITVGRGSPRGSVSTLADRVLLGRKMGDDSLGTRQHGDQCSGYPASMPNLARLQRLCPGMTQGLAAWAPCRLGGATVLRGQRLATMRVGREAAH